VLLSPSGSIVRGREALTTYYAQRFASGARGHAIKVVEVHVQGNGGYGVAQFSVMAPGANGSLHEVDGRIVAVYQHDPDGWRMRLVEANATEPASK
jgi:ketosteroid isomerase-like protein